MAIFPSGAARAADRAIRPGRRDGLAFDRRGRNTLGSHSSAFDLRPIREALWVTREAACAEVHSRLEGLRQYPLVSTRQLRLLSPRDAFERKAARMVEYPRER